jgi:hypothetical protein
MHCCRWSRRVGTADASVRDFYPTYFDVVFVFATGVALIDRRQQEHFQLGRNLIVEGRTA